MAQEKQTLSIWFFIGLILLIYGVLILWAGLQGLVSPAERTVTLANLHAGIWWGGFVLMLGVVYTWSFWPRGGER